MGKECATPWRGGRGRTHSSLETPLQETVITTHTSKAHVCIILLGIEVSRTLPVLDKVPRVALCEPSSDRRGQAVTAMIWGWGCHLHRTMVPQDHGSVLPPITGLRCCQ